MRLVVISNRVPVPSENDQAGGLTVALQDALSERGGVWFGWSGEVAPERARHPSLQEADGVQFATVPLTQADLDGYYLGYSNSALWPLFHERLDALEHRSEHWDAYTSVNCHFADRVRPLIRDDDVVWVQDYHLVPLGSELRERGVTGRIGFFMHTPFPPFDLLRALPTRAELVRDLFAYDLIGVQTEPDRRHLAEALRHQGATVDEDAGVAELDGRHVRFDAFPIGIDVERTAEIAREQRDSTASRELLASVQDRKLVIGADRMDYTKGLVERLRAFDRFLEAHLTDDADGPVFIQIAAPSREDVEQYQVMKRRLEAEAGRINGRTNQIDWTPFRLITRGVPRDTLLGYFSQADVGFVTPVRDGMNLVAKEFLAAQPEDDPGVLVLSNLAGAADELGDVAVIVNPYDVDEVAAGLARALDMELSERRRRWEDGMRVLRGNTARQWRDRFLGALTVEVDEVEGALSDGVTPSGPRPPRRRPRPHVPDVSTVLGQARSPIDE